MFAVIQNVGGELAVVSQMRDLRSAAEMDRELRLFAASTMLVDMRTGYQVRGYERRCRGVYDNACEVTRPKLSQPSGHPLQKIRCRYGLASCGGGFRVRRNKRVNHV